MAATPSFILKHLCPQDWYTFGQLAVSPQSQDLRDLMGDLWQQALRMWSYALSIAFQPPDPILSLARAAGYITRRREEYDPGYNKIRFSNVFFLDTDTFLRIVREPNLWGTRRHITIPPRTQVQLEWSADSPNYGGWDSGKVFSGVSQLTVESDDDGQINHYTGEMEFQRCEVSPLSFWLA